MVNLADWIAALNELFGPGSEPIPPEAFPNPAEPITEDTVAGLGAAMPGADIVLRSLPEGHVAALVGLLQNASARGVAVTFAWMPSYDHELTITEIKDEGEVCGITVLLKSRHKSDPRMVGG